MPVSYEKRDHIGVVTLSRPGARNAWGADFNEGLRRHFTAMEDDDEIRCAVLTGDESGGAFSAGANLKDPKTHTMASTADWVTERNFSSLPRRAFSTAFCREISIRSRLERWKVRLVRVTSPAEKMRRMTFPKLILGC